MSRENEERLNQRVNELERLLGQYKARNAELERIHSDPTLKPYPLWKLFFLFLQKENSGRELDSDQFLVREQDDKNSYSITVHLRNGRNNAYSNSRGGEGLRTRWYRFQEDPVNCYPPAPRPIVRAMSEDDISRSQAKLNS